MVNFHWHYESKIIRWLFNTIAIGYWNFENNRSINWLFGESAQH